MAFMIPSSFMLLYSCSDYTCSQQFIIVLVPLRQYWLLNYYCVISVSICWFLTADLKICSVKFLLFDIFLTGTLPRTKQNGPSYMTTSGLLMLMLKSHEPNRTHPCILDKIEPNPMNTQTPTQEQVVFWISYSEINNAQKQVIFVKSICATN